MTNPPAGWFPDPTDPNQQRYWDGRNWTGWTNSGPATPAAPYGPPPAVGAPAVYLPSLLAALVASFGIVVGSIGPWATFMAVSVNGVEGDGALTLVLGSVALVALFALFGRGGRAGRFHRWAGTAVGAVCLVIALVDLADIMSSTTELFGETLGADPGWGLWMVTISAAVLCVTSSLVAKTSGKP